MCNVRVDKINMPAWTTADGAARVCLGGHLGCLSIDAAALAVSQAGGWQMALPDAASALLMGNEGENCALCNGSIISDRGHVQQPHVTLHTGVLSARRAKSGIPDSDLYMRSPLRPGEVFNRSGSIGRLDELPDVSSAQVSSTDASHGAQRLGSVPELLPQQTISTTMGWRSFRRGGSPPFFLPCSSSRGEDAAAIRSFFSTADGRPVRGGTFLEIGGVDGLVESNTWVLERCFGWRGVLVEAHPLHFSRLITNRRASLNLHFAVCDSSSGGGWVSYSRGANTGAKASSRTVKAPAADSTRMHTQVECASLGGVLSRLGVRRLDLVSIDVEGSELDVVRSLAREAAAGRLAIGVVLVEVRSDGQRERILRALLALGMRYAGMLKARGNEQRDIVDDCYFNASHLSEHFGGW